MEALAPTLSNIAGGVCRNLQTIQAEKQRKRHAVSTTAVFLGLLLL